MVSISGNADGQESTNTMKYNADLLTKVSNGDTSYNYEYDGWSRTTKVKIAGKVYSQTEYVDNTQTKTVLANGDNLTATVDKYDRTTKQITSFANGITETIQIDYDNLPNIETVDIDISDGTKYNIVKTNEKGKVISEVRSGEYPLEMHYGYNADGDLESTKYKVGEQTIAYGYETDHTPDKRNSKVQLPFNVEQNFAYDGLGRTKEISLGDKLVKDIYYAKYGDHATNRVNSVWYGINGIRKDNIKYTYDNAGNIETVSQNGKLVARYRYDGLNRLVREDNVHFGTNTYQYDTAGNILNKSTYPYTLSEVLNLPQEVTDNCYKQHGWKDQLISSNGTECVYDALGNPTAYRNKHLTWQGRRLKQLDDTAFTYDVNGIRTSKLHNSILTKYFYDGNNLVAEQRGNDWIYYIYGVDGIAGFNYQGQTYLYRKNVQGDVTHIYKQEEDKSLTLVVEYVYDAWGNHDILDADDELDDNLSSIGNLNPFRYRSYYFDTETNLYYLQTRYYDPELGRFISADSIEYLDPETLGGLNLYAYCGNNPINFTDELGCSVFLTMLLIAIITGAVIGGTVNGVTAYNEGQRGWGLFGAIAGGAIMGGAMGAVMVIGGAAGLASILPAGMGIVGFCFTSTVAAFGASLAIGAGAGLVSYLLEDGLRTDRELSLTGAIKATTLGTVDAMTTFGLAFLGGRIGAFDGLILKPMLEGAKGLYPVVKALFSASFKVAGREFFTNIAWYLGETLSKLLLINLPATGLRWILDKLFNAN